MTLKVRLMTMMIVLVMGVLALQFILTEREKRELTSEIERLGYEVSSSAHDMSVRAFIASRSGHPVRDILMEIDSTSVDPRASFRYIRTESYTGPDVDVDVARDAGSGPARLRAPAALDSMDVELIVIDGASELDSVRDIVWREAHERGHARRIIQTPDGRVLAEFHIDDSDSLLSTTTEDVQTWVSSEQESLEGGTDRTMALRVPDPTVPPLGGTADFTFRFPIPVAEQDSLHFVEVRYPIDELTDRLAASRQRSILWVASLLGVGVLGAALMAAQFTRPIRALERSFRRVEEGDLDVAVTAGRDDEIGRLTSSFNHMVGRLRESREMEDRLQESERLAVIGRLAAGVAHEVRNPLNAIKLTMQQLRDKTAPPDGDAARGDFERYYRTVTRELDRLEGVVGAFLDLTRSESLSVEPMDLTRSVEKSVELFSADAADRDVTLTLETVGAFEITGDPARLATVWNNLLSNALAATPKRGRITVSITRDGPAATVRVGDTGAGVDAETLARIWEPFYSGRPDGTGLGLGIVRSVVERHGGQVSATSTPEEGTIVTVTLPIDGGPTPDPS